ncbi:helix-turn-helix transcriptional regulator [Actinoplanes sp. NPDC049548]|uniref:PadR family transcriptional regulator n=1 Tax=Actinoplanes sp. NPDC049548 TaxID=3155152 RepID=UPI003435CA85
MQEPTFVILTVLADGEQHGYGIMRAVEGTSRGAVTLRPGTLYAALDRLTLEGLVRVSREEHSPGGQLRRYYDLTPAGGDALRIEAEKRRQLALLALRRLRNGPATGATAHPA